MDDTEQLLQSASRLYNSECYDDSFTLVEIIISKKNLSIKEKTLFLAAKICEARQEFKTAIDFYLQTIKFIHECSIDDINYRLAVCYFKLKCFKDAEEAVLNFEL